MLERLGDFRLLREVGRGGMGIVYEAEQESLGRRVALKVLRSHRLHDPKILIRFHREAKAAARLHHTNIVPVFGVGEHEGVHFYVMQFIRGLAFDAVLAEVRRLRGSGTKGRTAARIVRLSSTAAGDLTVTDLAQSLATGRFVVARPMEPGPQHGRSRRRRRPTATAPRSRCSINPASRPRPTPPGCTCGAWRGSGSRWPRRSTMPTSTASCTAISSRRTSCSTPMAWSGSPISASPRSSATAI